MFTDLRYALRTLAKAPGYRADQVTPPPGRASRFPGPLRGSNASGTLFIEGRPSTSGAEQPYASLGSVSGGYFKAMGIPVLAGRTFTERENADGAPVGIVSTSLARRYWPGESAVGIAALMLCVAALGSYSHRAALCGSILLPRSVRTNHVP